MAQSSAPLFLFQATESQQFSSVTSVLDETHAGCSNFLKQMCRAEIPCSVSTAATCRYLHPAFCAGRTRQLMPPLSGKIGAPGLEISFLAKNWQRGALTVYLTASWSRHQAGINTAHAAWGSTEGKGPGYLVDNSHCMSGRHPWKLWP